MAKSFKKSNRNLLQFCRDNNIKFVITNPVYFINKEDYLLYKVVNAIKQNSTIENLNKDELVDEEFYFKDAKVFKNAFVKLPEALQNQEYIINHCNVDLKLKEYKFPLYKLPEGENAFSLLWDLCQQGLEKRYKKITPKILERISYELSVINELNFSNYFLIVWDIVKEAQNRGMMLIGRGSAANSLVAYVLGLTQVDPIKHNLFFERFLNRGRSSPPDVDIDFSWKERDEIIRYIFQKYGYENCAMISTTITFRARSAFREVAKAFGLSNEEISKYSKFIPWTNAINLKNISEKFPESKSLNFNIEPFKSIVELASQLANFPRHLSIHPSGIIITPGPVTNFTALEYAKNKGLGLIITQPDMYSIEDLGLIKIDILSQRSLGVLRDTVAMIKHNKK